MSRRRRLLDPIGDGIPSEKAREGEPQTSKRVRNNCMEAIASKLNIVVNQLEALEKRIEIVENVSGYVSRENVVQNDQGVNVTLTIATTQRVE